MANEVYPATPDGVSVDITTLSADFDFSLYITNAVYEIYEIVFNPGAAGESLIIRNGSDPGAIFSRMKSIDGSTLVDKFGYSVNALTYVQRYVPFIKLSDCAVSSGTASVTIRYGFVA